MSARFSSGTTDFYQATTGLPAASPWTITMWAKQVVAGTEQAIVNVSANPPGAINILASDGTSSTFGMWDYTNYAGPPLGGLAFTTGTWYRIGIVINGANISFYRATATGDLTPVTAANWTASETALLRIGANGFSTAGTRFNGSVAAFKMWNAALSDTEVAAELARYVPLRTANLLRYHPLINTETTDYSGNGNTLSGGTGSVTEDGPPIPWGPIRSHVSVVPRMPTVEVGQAVTSTANFEVAIQAVETGAGITTRAWTVVSGPAEVATTIGTASLLSWYPATAGVYQLEYEVTNPAGTAYDTVYVTVNPGGTVVNTQTAAGTGTTLVCNRPVGLAQYDVMLAVQSGDFAAHDEMDPPTGWQPLFEYDLGQDALHVKGWTLTAGAGEPATYTFAQGTGSAGVVSITALRGVVEAGIQSAITYDATTGATRAAPSVEKAVPGAVLLAGAVTDPGAARTWTPPTGMTEQADVQVTTNTTHTIASLLDPGGPTGARDFTLSGTAGAAGGVQWAAVFPMPPDPKRGVDNKSMISFVKTT